MRTPNGRAVVEALHCGAMGFSTSRASTHVTPDGSPIASRIAEWEEIDYLVGKMAEHDAGIFQVKPDVSSGAAHRTFLERLRKVALDTRRPIMFGTISTRQGDDPLPYQSQLDYIDETVAKGGRMIGQTTTRSINALFSFQSYLPFDNLPIWREFRSRPMEEQQRLLREDPDLRRKLVAEEAGMKPRDNVFQGGGAATTDPRKPDYSNLYAVVGVDWDDPSVAELSEQRGRNPVEVMIDLALENDMNQLSLQPLVNESPEHVREMLDHPHTLATFSDSGAHVCQEMGSSLQTHMLSYWVRKKQAFTLEKAVRMLTFDNAAAWDLEDRGLVRTGMAADLVLFEEDRIKPCIPTVETDLPGGARRLVQKAEGIHATIVNGKITLENGDPTGELGGQLLKGPAAI
jgi:N-acyl-D-aspartate/D-glutamate deacylase